MVGLEGLLQKLRERMGPLEGAVKTRPAPMRAGGMSGIVAALNDRNSQPSDGMGQLMGAATQQFAPDAQGMGNIIGAMERIPRAPASRDLGKGMGEMLSGLENAPKPSGSNAWGPMVPYIRGDIQAGAKPGGPLLTDKAWGGFNDSIGDAFEAAGGRSRPPVRNDFGPMIEALRKGSISAAPKSSSSNLIPRRMNAIKRK